MARVWFVRRCGVHWVAPGGQPAFDLPLASLVFPLDLGTHRRLSNEKPLLAPDLPIEGAEELQKVLVETTEADLTGQEFSGYQIGVYDSPYSPREVVRRLRV